MHECDVILSSTYSSIIQHSARQFKKKKYIFVELNSWYPRMLGANPFCLLSLVEFDIKWSWIEIAGYSVVMDTEETTGFPTEKKGM